MMRATVSKLGRRLLWPASLLTLGAGACLIGRSTPPSLSSGAAPTRHDPLQQQVHRNTAGKGATRAAAPANPNTVMPPVVCFAPGTDPAYQAKVEGRLYGKRGEIAFFRLSNRWTTTATDGGGLVQGDPTTLTWSFVPDGTAIPGSSGEPAAPNNVHAFLNGLYGNQATWQPLFQQIFDRWSVLTGINYVYEPTDDGASFPNSPGVIGSRGDLRIAGHIIDGPSGILAYNFFPNQSDMVLDTADGAIFGNMTNGSRSLRNILAHEHGHGMGFDHTCPTDQTKLMEPFLSTAFDGPQPDDILAAQRGYGDALEKNGTPRNNDTTGHPTALGALPLGTRTIDTVSIDGTSDVDVYSFSPPAASTFATITLRPTGTTYPEGPQDQITGACGAGTPFNSQTVNDVNMELLAANGSTVLATANSRPAGQNETIVNFVLPGTGPFFVRVTGGTVDNVQVYGLDIALSASVAPTPTPQPTVGPTPTPTTAPTPTPTPFPVGPSQIAFTTNRDGNSEIYRMNADGTKQTRVTTNPATDDLPYLLHSSAMILFSSNRDRNREIYRMNSDGTNQLRLTNNAASDYEPQVSPDGRSIVFTSTRDGNAEIYIMNFDGTGVRRLTNNPGTDDHATFSSDSLTVAFHSYRAGNDDIYTMRAVGSGLGTNVKRLTTAAGVDSMPNFNFDGKRIVFQSNRNAGQYEIYVMESDGTKQTRLTFNNATDTLPCFNPFSSQIAFTSTRGGGDNEIFVMDVGGERVSLKQLTNNSVNDTQPSWGIGNVPITAGLNAEVEGQQPLSSITAKTAGSGASKAGLSSATIDAASGLVKLTFDGALDAQSVSHLSNFTVEIGGRAVEVASAGLLGNDTISLLLPDDALQSGDTVVVAWHGLEDAEGAKLSGNSGPLVAK